MKVLVVAAHPDDEILGCGGTMARYSSKLHEVTTILLGEGRVGAEAEPYEANKAVGVDTVLTHSLPDNRFDSIPLLDVVNEIEDEILNLAPDVVFTHFKDDLNIDHRITYQAVMTVLRPCCGGKCDIFSFFVPSATDFSSESFNPNVFSNISAEMGKKVDALREYESEMRTYPHSRSITSCENIARYWGNRVGMEYAEPFILVRGYI